MPLDAPSSCPPIAIGGVGGSGTRLIAELLRSLGVYLGADLNDASDTLWFTLLFKREEILAAGPGEFDRLATILSSALRGGPSLGDEDAALIEALASEGRPQHSSAWLSARAKSLLAATQTPRPYERWGWKEPNTHIVIERLFERLPGLRYVHVVRHGVDMAFSRNQNQLDLWGGHILGNTGEPSPTRSLAYWVRVHQRIRRLLAVAPARTYWLDYDAFCRSPGPEASKLAGFLELSLPDEFDFSHVKASGHPRHSGMDLSQFDSADLAYVESLGYRLER